MTIEEIGGWTGLIGGIAGMAALIFQWLDHRARKAESRVVLEVTQKLDDTDPAGLTVLYVRAINRRATTATWTSLRVINPRAKLSEFSARAGALDGRAVTRFDRPFSDAIELDALLEPGDFGEMIVGFRAPPATRTVTLESLSLDKETGKLVKSRASVPLKPNRGVSR